MSRRIAALPVEQVVYFAACDVVYRGLVGIGAPLQPLGDHFDILAGYAFKSSEFVPDGVRLLRNINVKPERIDWTDAVCLPDEGAVEYERFRLSVGDLVMSMDGTVNKQGIKIAFLHQADVPALLLQRVCRFDPLGSVERRFLYHILHSEEFLDHIAESNRSIAIPHVSPGQLKSFRIPIAEHSTQIAIGDFLDSVRAGLPSSNWAHLPKGLAEQQRIVARIEELATQIQEAKALRKQAAEEAEALGKFSLRALGDERQLSEVCLQITDGEHVTPPRVPEPGVPLATAKNVRDGFLDMAITDFVDQETATKCWKRCRPTHDDILMVCVGATIGRVCRLVNPPDIVIVRSVALLRPAPDKLDARYLEYALESNELHNQIWALAKQAAQPCLYLNRMARLRIPVPSLPEQRRIVAELDALQAEVDKLKRLQAETAAELDALLPSILDKAFKGEL